MHMWWMLQTAECFMRNINLRLKGNKKLVQERGCLTLKYRIAITVYRIAICLGHPKTFECQLVSPYLLYISLFRANRHYTIE